jgi:acetylornithine deacetylase
MMAQLIATSSVSSVSPKFDQSNIPVIELLAAWLEDAGFAVEIQSVSPTKANLLARLGEGDQGLLLSGHTDTVPFDDGRWTSDPLKLTERDCRLYGLGTADMKCFLALAIEAARGLKPTDLARPLLILATADEESSMSGARALARSKLSARYAVIGEPTGLKPINRHKGVFMEAVRLIGASGHSSNPAYGNSALEGMHEVIGELLAWRTELIRTHQNPGFEVASPTLNLGYISGGDNPNRICGDCRLHLDMRPLPGMDIELLREELRRRVNLVAHRRGLKTEFDALFPGVPAFYTQPESDIVQAAHELSGHICGSVGFATEGPYLNALGIDTVILGPGSISVAHQPDEYLELAAIPATLTLLRKLITRFCMRV